MQKQVSQKEKRKEEEEEMKENRKVQKKKKRKKRKREGKELISEKLKDNLLWYQTILENRRSSQYLCQYETILMLCLCLREATL